MKSKDCAGKDLPGVPLIHNLTQAVPGCSVLSLWALHHNSCKLPTSFHIFSLGLAPKILITYYWLLILTQPLKNLPHLGCAQLIWWQGTWFSCWLKPSPCAFFYFCAVVFFSLPWILILGRLWSGSVCWTMSWCVINALRCYGNTNN